MPHLAILIFASALVADPQAQWGQWRGPLSTGEAPLADPPVSWSNTNNVRWKAELPGRGHSTPIVWEDRVFVTAAIPTGPKLPPKYSGAPGAHDNLPVTQRQQYAVIAIDRHDGSIVWQKKLRENLPHEGAHYTGSLASNSPVTDGESVFAFFGSHGLFAVDYSGKIRWSKNLGTMNTKHGHGEGASPALFGNSLVVNWDHEGDSFIVALDKRTGTVLWHEPRDEGTSWATPIIVEHNGKPQVIVSGTTSIRAYDLETGKVVWQAGGLSRNVVASPVAHAGMAFAGSSYDWQALFAINFVEASGDLTGSDRIVWQRSRGTPYVPSLLLYENSLFFLSHYQGIMSRVNATTGADDPGAFRLAGLRNIYASPVAAAGRIYVTDRMGTTSVLRDGNPPQPLSINRLDEEINASAAIAGTEFFLRGTQHLFCLGDVDKKN